jgi:drug/metabolite transporter (DMT)-like permease
VIATLGGMMAPADAARRGQLLCAAAAVVWSSAGPVQRAVDATSPTQVAVRAGVGAVALLAYLVVRRGRGALGSLLHVGRAGLLVAVCLAAVSSAFILALAHTTVAHVLLFQASSPFVAALLAWFLMREAIPFRTWIAMAAALLGVGIMVGGSVGSGGLWGDALCVLMSAGFAVVIVVTRSHREISMTPATALGMAIAFAATAPFSHIGGVPTRDILLLAALGAGQIALGLILFTAGARLIPAAQAGLITLIEIVLGPLWVWLIYREEPDTLTIVGGSVIVGAVLLHAFAELRRPARLRAQPEALT